MRNRSIEWTVTVLLLHGCTDPVVLGELPRSGFDAAAPAGPAMWRSAAYVKPRIHEANNNFGTSLAWADHTLLVGASSSGDCGAEVIADPPDFLCRHEGTVSVISMMNLERPYRFLKASTPQIQGKFGRTVVSSDAWVFVSANGQIVDDLNSAGSVYVFRRDGDEFIEAQRLVADVPMRSGEFGAAVAVDREWLAVFEAGLKCQTDAPCRSESKVHLFRLQEELWRHRQVLVPDAAGYPLSSAGVPRGSVSIDDERLAVGLVSDDRCEPRGEEACPRAGVVFMYSNDGERWGLDDVLEAQQRTIEGDYGGSTILRGDELFVGAPGQSLVDVFQYEDETWRRIQELSIPDAESGFGTALDLDEDRLVVGAPDERNCLTGVDPGPDWDTSCNAFGVGPGAARLYERGDDGRWSEALYMKPNTTRFGIDYGGSVAVRGNRIAVGAQDDANVGVGLNAPKTEGFEAVGAVFVYEWGP